MEYLALIGRGGETTYDIAGAALMLAALDHPGLPLEPARTHLRDIEAAMRGRAASIRRVGDGAKALAELLAGQYGYDGDRATYDDPANADLIAVIERRRGLPVALGVLYIHAARAAGLKASGLDTAGHFLIRVTHRHDDVTLDPFNGGALVADGTALLAQPVSDTEVLLRLQNNLKMRALEKDDTARSLAIAERMATLAPRRADLWFDLARLNEASGIFGAACAAYESCLALSRAGDGLHNEATLLLANLKRRLN